MLWTMATLPYVKTMQDTFYCDITIHSIFQSSQYSGSRYVSTEVPFTKCKHLNKIENLHSNTFTNPSHCINYRPKLPVEKNYFTTLWQKIVLAQKKCKVSTNETMCDILPTKWTILSPVQTMKQSLNSRTA